MAVAMAQQEHPQELLAQPLCIQHKQLEVAHHALLLISSDGDCPWASLFYFPTRVKHIHPDDDMLLQGILVFIGM